MNDDHPRTTKKRAIEIKKRYVPSTSTLDGMRFGALFNSDFSVPELNYHECSEAFTVADVDKLIGLACEMELDHCDGFDNDYLYQYATLHAMNALLLLVSNDRSIADTIAQRFAHRCAATIPDSSGDFVTETLEFHMVMLLCECGPIAIPHLITEIRWLLLTPNPPKNSWLGAINVCRAVRSIIRECYKDIPLAITLTHQFCAPLLEYGKHPTAIHNPVNQENASFILSVLVDVAILITDEKEVLELCRSGKCDGGGFDHSWIDVLRLFSLEPHPQDEKLRNRGNRMDWVIQTWNENHPDKQYPLPRGVVDGPFPGQPGYELPKRLFRHKYCRGSFKCRYESTGIPVHVKVCERCKHVYYCSDACQAQGWYGHGEEAIRIKYESYPLKFRTRPLKRLKEYHKSRIDSSFHHYSHCLLVEAYKQWVIIDKQQRKVVKEEAGQHQKKES